MLAHLLQESGTAGLTAGPTDVEIQNITADSREVKTRSLFVALRGQTVDGHDYIASAIERGAGAVVAETPAPADRPADLAWIQVDNTSASLGVLADAYNGHPSRSLKVLAVTGTNGKTTVTWLLDHILRETGHRPRLLGTVETRIGDTRRTANYTTPLAHELHALLGEMRDVGCSHALMEASSHGLHQERMAG
ncbi:MAG: Mur ligase family protein, partial [Myxococcota bacterium]|nr:Mur ligase family protein [Myxococcota bacterium]